MAYSPVSVVLGVVETEAEMWERTARTARSVAKKFRAEADEVAERDPARASRLRGNADFLDEHAAFADSKRKTIAA